MYKVFWCIVENGEEGVNFSSSLVSLEVVAVVQSRVDENLNVGSGWWWGRKMEQI